MRPRAGECAEQVSGNTTAPVFGGSKVRYQPGAVWTTRGDRRGNRGQVTGDSLRNPPSPSRPNAVILRERPTVTRARTAGWTLPKDLRPAPRTHSRAYPVVRRA